MRAIVGIKKGMTRIFVEDKAVPVTIVDVSDCKVSSVLGKGVEFGVGKVKRGKALTGKYAKLGYVPRFRVYLPQKNEDVKVGDKLESTVFNQGDKVSIVAQTKGKGFAGVVKRWGFSGGSRTHGQSDRQRAPGSIGAGTTPGRVLKGKRMAGRMGGDRITLDNKQVVDVKADYILVGGPIPGNSGDPVLIYSKE